MFGQLFDDFEHTAFRLEVRSRYAPSYEGESLRKYLAGEPDDLPWMQDWLRMVERAAREGRRFSRVRVVDLPLSEYNTFSLAVSARNNAAGEDIRYVSRDRARDLPDYDYWLFDSRTLLQMHFDQDDRFTHGEIIDDPAEVVQHNYWRDAAWHQAVGRDDFATEQRVRRI
ncbi:MAG TPA: hypothetical protein VHX38_17475 [Pseudonocardiaceae bacterium]|nr:hypothetical protein [Pseudonocardiaceae bacterium]